MKIAFDGVLHLIALYLLSVLLPTEDDIDNDLTEY